MGEPNDIPVATGKPGRKGDPRMHQAVKARLRNPTLSLHEALREGGFVFFPRPGTDPAHATESSLSDCDGILLCQRKNQLSRRLRSIRDKPNASHIVLSDEEERIEFNSPDPSIDQSCSKRNLTDPAIDPRFMRNRPYSRGKRKVGEMTHQSQFDQTGMLTSNRFGLTKSSQTSRHQDLIHEIPDPGADHSMSSMPLEQGSQACHYSIKQTNQLPPLPISDSNSEQLRSFIRNKNRLRSALEHYRVESNLLLKRCMALAGFEVYETDETNLAYISFLDSVIDFEKQRLDNLLSKYSTDFGDSSNDFDSCDDTSHNPNALGISEIIDAAHMTNHEDQVPHNNSLRDLAPWANYGNNCRESHDHSHHHSQSFDERNEKTSDNCLYEGKHVHRLEGRCGHKAVIHKPDGGSPHVDFLVDGKIECYSDVQPTKKDEAMWPSRYNCEDIMCSNKSGCHKNYLHGNADDCLFGPDIVAPKVIDISEIDMKSNEWNIEFFNNDDNSMDSTLLGLFKLGDGVN